jgi:hypothetical protein
MPPYINEPYTELSAPKIRHESIDFAEQFTNHWSRGLPLVVTGVRQQGVWDPAYFITTYHDTPVTLENCETGELISSTVAKFFSSILAPDPEAGVWKLKVSSSSFPPVSKQISYSLTYHRTGLLRQISKKYFRKFSRILKILFHAPIL